MSSTRPTLKIYLLYDDNRRGETRGVARGSTRGGMSCVRKKIFSNQMVYEYIFSHTRQRYSRNGKMSVSRQKNVYIKYYFMCRKTTMNNFVTPRRWQKTLNHSQEKSCVKICFSTNEIHCAIKKKKY